MKKITVTKYESHDGRVFDSQCECETYERNRRSESEDAYEALPHAADTADAVSFTYRYAQDDEFRFIRIKNMETVCAINSYLLFHAYDKSELLTEDDIGTVQVFWSWAGSPCEVWKIGTPKKWKDGICEELDEFIKKMTEEI